MAKNTNQSSFYIHAANWLRVVDALELGATLDFGPGGALAAQDIVRLNGHIISCVVAGAPLRDYAAALVAVRSLVGRWARYSNPKRSALEGEGSVKTTANFLLNADRLVSHLYWLLDSWAAGHHTDLFSVPNGSLAPYSAYINTSKVVDSVYPVLMRRLTTPPNTDGLARVEFSTGELNASYTKQLKRLHKVPSDPTIIDQRAAAAAAVAAAPEPSEVRGGSDDLAELAETDIEAAKAKVARDVAIVARQAKIDDRAAAVKLLDELAAADAADQAEVDRLQRAMSVRADTIRATTLAKADLDREISYLDAAIG